MNVWPAVDILDGRCVRLRRGRFDEVTEFARDPVAVAEAFAREGADRLHVVDLAGARSGAPAEAEAILEVRRRLDVRLQVGGGIRTDDDASRYLEAGVDRVIVGTAALRRPGWLGDLVRRHGPRAVAAALDVRDGDVVVEGWETSSGVGRDEALAVLDGAGIGTVVYTDTVRDGTLTRPDVRGARTVVRAGFRTLVAGGVSRVDDVAALRAAGAHGVVIGSALYRGTLALGDALAAARGDETGGASGRVAPGETLEADGADGTGRPSP